MMKSIFIYCIAMLFTFNMYAQHTFKAILKDAEKKPLQSATASIKTLNKSAVADSSGFVTLKNIPAGKFEVMFSHVGFEEKVILFEFPIVNDSIIEIELTETEHKENVVIVTSTRTSRSIANIPTRIETISGEELQEKGNMKPGDIRMMLNESTAFKRNRHLQQVTIQAYGYKGLTENIRKSFVMASLCIQVFQEVWVYCRLFRLT